MPNIKLSKEQRKSIVERWESGEITQPDLAAAYSVAPATIHRICKGANAKKPKKPRPATVQDITEFASRAKSILWRQDSGGPDDRIQYNKWVARVKALCEGGGFSRPEAVVRASKEFLCLIQLFREYNVRKFDQNPDSHPRIKHFGDEEEEHEVHCEGRDQSYRENLRWAIEAAGETSRTGSKPDVCPCNAAWYLYEQACNDPKDFLARIGQVESKGDADAEEKRSAHAAGTRSMAEIDGMLAELEGEENKVLEEPYSGRSFSDDGGAALKTEGEDSDVDAT